MTSFRDFSVFAASRGEGLHPKLRELFERSAVSPFSYVSVRPDGMLQAGPNPGSGNVGSQDLDMFPSPSGANSRNSGDTAMRLRRGDPRS